MRSLILLPLASVAALALAGCNETQVANSINAACTAAAVGTTIAVQVAGQVNNIPAQTISGKVGSDIGEDCPSITSAATAAINVITSRGQTATVSVITEAPRSGKRKLLARARIRGVGDGKVVTYVVSPPFALPDLGKL